jgi:hypothetical protein
VPKIVDFSADRTRIAAGERVVLSWKTEDGDTVTLTPPLHTVNANGFEELTPAVSTRYDLVIKNGCSQVSQSVWVHVTEPSLPEIVSFVADRSLISPGESIFLSWETRNADRIVISNLQNAPSQLPLKGRLQQTLERTITFTLTAYRLSRSVSASVTVEVKRPLPVIDFKIDPTEIWQGMTATLLWSTANATRCELLTSSINPVSIPCNGTRQVAPLVTTVYMIVAYNAANESTSATRVLRVR